jgi:hypothetical protein
MSIFWYPCLSCLVKAFSLSFHLLRCHCFCDPMREVCFIRMLYKSWWNQVFRAQNLVKSHRRFDSKFLFNKTLYEDSYFFNFHLFPWTWHANSFTILMQLCSSIPLKLNFERWLRCIQLNPSAHVSISWWSPLERGKIFVFLSAFCYINYGWMVMTKLH